MLPFSKNFRYLVTILQTEISVITSSSKQRQWWNPQWNHFLEELRRCNPNVLNLYNQDTSKA